MSGIVLVSAARAVAETIAQVSIGVVGTGGLAELGDVGSSGSRRLTACHTHPIVPEVGVRAHRNAVPRHRVRKGTSRTTSHALGSRIIPIGIHIATGRNHTVIGGIGIVPHRTDLHAAVVVLEEGRGAAGLAETVDGVSVLTVAAHRRTIIVRRIAVEVGVGRTHTHAGSTSEGQSEIWAAGGLAETSGGLRPEIGWTCLEAGPVAIVAESGRTGRTHIHAQHSQIVGKGSPCTLSHAESIHSIGIPKCAIRTPLHTGIS
jgi:hypothetical protein